MINYHLVILKKPYLDLILEGKKTIELRLLRTNKEPFAKVKPGDCLFLKQSSGPVCGQAVVSAVKFFDKLTPEKIFVLKRQYNNQILGDDEYWKSKSNCSFAVLVWLDSVRPIEPVWISKKDWRGWVVLTENQNFGLFKLVRR